MSVETQVEEYLSKNPNVKLSKIVLKNTLAVAREIPNFLEPEILNRENKYLIFKWIKKDAILKITPITKEFLVQDIQLGPDNEPYGLTYAEENLKGVQTLIIEFINSPTVEKKFPETIHLQEVVKTDSVFSTEHSKQILENLKKHPGLSRLDQSESKLVSREHCFANINKTLDEIEKEHYVLSPKVHANIQLLMTWLPDNFEPKVFLDEGKILFQWIRGHRIFNIYIGEVHMTVIESDLSERIGEDNGIKNVGIGQQSLSKYTPPELSELSNRILNFCTEGSGTFSKDEVMENSTNARDAAFNVLGAPVAAPKLSEDPSFLKGPVELNTGALHNVRQTHEAIPDDVQQTFDTIRDDFLKVGAFTRTMNFINDLHFLPENWDTDNANLISIQVTQNAIGIIKDLESKLQLIQINELIRHLSVSPTNEGNVCLMFSKVRAAPKKVAGWQNQCEALLKTRYYLSIIVTDEEYYLNYISVDTDSDVAASICGIKASLRTSLKPMFLDPIKHFLAID
jgi:hypothetical protein